MTRWFHPAYTVKTDMGGYFALIGGSTPSRETAITARNLTFGKGDGMTKKEGKCSGCNEHKPLTKHHIFPRRHYGRQHNKFIFLLCRSCHNELEKRIPLELIPKRFYVSILITFLLERHDEETDT